MADINLLLSMPGGTEWLVIILVPAFLIACPVLAIIFYLQAKRLRQENKELLTRLLDREK